MLTFDWEVIGLSYFTCALHIHNIAFGRILCQSGTLVNLVNLTSKSDLLYANFWLRCDRAFIFHMCFASDNTFSESSIRFNLLTLTSKFDLLYANFWHRGDRAFIFHMCIESCIFINLVTLISKFYLFSADFWLRGDRAFIFHTCIAFDNTFPNLVYYLTLWPWPQSVNYFMLT